MKKVLSMFLVTLICLTMFFGVSASAPVGVPPTTRWLGESGKIGTYYDFFPDRGFAAVVAKEMGKQPHQYTTEADLALLEKLDYGRNSSYNTIEVKSLQGISNLKGLKTFSLHHHKLKEISVEIRLLSDLEELRITGWRNAASIEYLRTPLTKVPPQLNQLKNLRILDLSGNRIESIPPQLRLLPNLVELNFSHNEISVIPAQISQLDTLVTLGISNNKLKTLTPQLQNLTNLNEFDFGENAIAEIPNGIMGLGVRGTRLGMSYQNIDMGEIEFDLSKPILPTDVFPPIVFQAIDYENNYGPNAGSWRPPVEDYVLQRAHILISQGEFPNFTFEREVSYYDIMNNQIDLEKLFPSEGTYQIGHWGRADIRQSIFETIGIWYDVKVTNIKANPVKQLAALNKLYSTPQGYMEDTFSAGIFIDDSFSEGTHSLAQQQIDNLMITGFAYRHDADEFMTIDSTNFKIKKATASVNNNWMAALELTCEVTYPSGTVIETWEIGATMY